jgi:hypothetical protein
MTGQLTIVPVAVPNQPQTQEKPSARIEAIEHDQLD